MEVLSFTTGEGERATPQDLEERLRIVEEKIRRDAREMVEVFKVDIPQFVRRQVRERFIASGEFADSFDAERLRALKADVEATAQRAGAEIVPLLEEWSVWIDGAKAAPPASERKELTGNPDIQARLQRAGAYVKDVLERHGFRGVSAEEIAAAYRLPTWFIGGRLLVSLVESYWRNVEEYLAIRDALRALRERDQKAKRAERWDSV